MIGRSDVRSLLGAYALDALSREERRRVEAALDADSQLAELVALDLRVAEVLAEGLVDPAARASTVLWRRIDAATRP
jgi:anti-sigma-K factor RskA